MKNLLLKTAVAFALLATIAIADDFKNEPGFVSLYNGKDLTGWGYRDNEIGRAHD